MTWSTLNFGKHKGKSLPQIIFSDPDWFFWAVEEGVFENKGLLKQEAYELRRKSRCIRIPQKSNQELLAEYAIHPSTEKFAHMELVPSSRPSHEGATPTFRRNVIDLSIPREIAPYDKLGCQLLISKVKFYLFGKSKYRMTKKRCENFFNNDNNFDI